MKDALRRRLLSTRAALSPEDRRRGSLAVVDRLRHLPVSRRARVVAGYHPLSSEIDPMGFLLEAIEGGRVVALPRVTPRGLALHQWNPGDDLEAGPLGIREPRREAPGVAPSDLDLILVPGVGFDDAGRRLGFGQGYYDRLLSGIDLEARVGLCFDEQRVDAVPAEAHDERMGWIVSPTRTHHATRPKL